jgi:hypothetical protein
MMDGTSILYLRYFLDTILSSNGLDKRMDIVHRQPRSPVTVRAKYDKNAGVDFVVALTKTQHRSHAKLIFGEDDLFYYMTRNSALIERHREEKKKNAFKAI